MKLASAGGGDTDPSITGAIGGLSSASTQNSDLGGQAPDGLGEDAPASSDDLAAVGGECTLGFAGLPEVNRAAVATLRLSSSCGPIEKVLISYGGRTFQMSPADDRFELDLFAGPEKVDIQDPRGGRVAWTPTKATFQGVAKAVLLWSAPIDLDLKVREYSAREGSDGVLSAAQRGTLAEAAGAGRGFISTIDDGSLRSEHVEVYTFVSQAVSPQGEVAFGVEPAASADQVLCAEGKDQRYETYLLVNGVKKERNRSLVGNVGCQVADATESGRRLRGFQARLATPF
jgi:hypothetical protein